MIIYNQETCIKLSWFLAQNIKIYWYLYKKKLKKLKFEMVRKKLEKSQNIFNIVWCLENANTHIRWNF
jgi:hypothetical protein